MLVRCAAQHIQHMQKALTQMNGLQHVISDITGKTGMDIIEAIDPYELAKLRNYRIRADEATIARSLQGHWRQEHIFELTQALELYRVYQGKIAECDLEIENQLGRFEDRSDGAALASNRKRRQKNAPQFDVRNHLYRMTGVDLTQIDGVDGFTARSRSARTLAQRQALRLLACPNNRITGGRTIRLCAWRPMHWLAPTTA